MVTHQRSFISDGLLVITPSKVIDTHSKRGCKLFVLNVQTTVVTITFFTKCFLHEEFFWRVVVVIFLMDAINVKSFCLWKVMIYDVCLYIKRAFRYFFQFMALPFENIFNVIFWKNVWMVSHLLYHVLYLLCYIFKTNVHSINNFSWQKEKRKLFRPHKERQLSASFLLMSTRI